MKTRMSVTLAIVMSLAAWSNATAWVKVDAAEISRFQQAAFKGDCTGYAPVAETLLAEAENDRTSFTPYVLASTSICAAKAEQWALSENLALRMYPKTFDAQRDWLLSVPLERVVVELADMPGGAAIALRVIERNSSLVGQYPGDLQRREQMLKVARAAALYSLARAEEATAFVDPKAMELQVDRRFEATWAPPAQIAAENLARYEAMLGDQAQTADAGQRFEAAMALNRTQVAVATAREMMRSGDSILLSEWETMNARTNLIRALMRAGRVDAALEAYDEGVPPDDGRNTIFHRRGADGLTALMLIKADRIAEARELLARLKPIPIGEDVGAVAVLNACVSKLMGGAGLPDGQAVWVGTVWNLDALLCAASEDQVAVQVVRTLERPATRLGALVALQTHLEPPPLGKTEVAMRSRRADFLNRPDVRAEIARRGRVLATGTYAQE